MDKTQEELLRNTLNKCLRAKMSKAEVVETINEITTHTTKKHLEIMKVVDEYFPAA